MKHLFIVKNITSGEVSSPAVYRKDAVLGGETYSLLKKDGEDLPTGDYVYQLSEKEFKAAYSLPIFMPLCNDIREYKRADNKFCSEIILQFESDAGTLSLADTNSLLSLLGGVLQFLQINSPHNAKELLENVVVNALFNQQAKDKYLYLLSEHLNKLPR